MNDWGLLQEFVRNGSEEAFEEIVRRYANFVRMLCHRQLGDAHLCEDAAQATFVVLACKARSLSSDTVLSGWLIRTARFACANVLKQESRRRRTERQATELAGVQIGRDTGVLTAAILDEGLGRLSSDERKAVLLKIVEGRKLKEVASILKISEEAAEKRASRALEKLQRHFAEEKLPIAIVPAMLSIGEACAPSNAAALTQVALADIHAAGAVSKATIKMMFWARAKSWAAQVAILAVLGGGLFAMVRGNESTPEIKADLYLPPLQDEATLKQAWQKFVTVDIHDKTLAEVFADFTSQTGVAIYVDPDCKTDLRTDGVSAISVKYSMSMNSALTRARAQAFLTPGQIAQINLATGSLTRGAGQVGSTAPEVKSFTTSAPLPLAMILGQLVDDYRGYEISYRKDGIFLSTRLKLLPEMLITRQFKLQHPCGSIYQNSLNSVPFEARLSLLDTYAKVILDETKYDDTDQDLPAARSEVEYIGEFEGARLPNYPGVIHRRLLSLKRGMDVSYNEQSRMLTITATPYIMDRLNSSVIRDLDIPSPEELAAGALKFLESRIQQLVQAAQISDDERKALTAHAKELDSAEFDAREAAEKALQKGGIAAIKVLSDLAAGHTTSEFRERANRIIKYNYAEAELSGLRSRCEAYFKAGCSGDVETAYRDFWCASRRTHYDTQSKVFESQKAAAVGNPKAIASLIEQYNLKAGTPLDALSYRTWRANYFSKDAPRLEGIRLSGDRAAIVYSCETEVLDAESGKKSTTRYNSSFDMIFEENRWVAADSVTLIDPKPIVWTRTDGAANSANGGAVMVGKENTVGAGIWSVAANFGY